jgi:hypothetical protein
MAVLRPVTWGCHVTDVTDAMDATGLDWRPQYVSEGLELRSSVAEYIAREVGQNESWELGSDDVCHVTPTHISSDDPSPNVTKCGGALRRTGNSCASLGS